jgi:hypothetical protein
VTSGEWTIGQLEATVRQKYIHLIATVKEVTAQKNKVERKDKKKDIGPLPP